MELVKTYNPANAASLTPDQLLEMQSLTSAQIKELAQAYPNITMQRAYLLIVDSTKPPEKQLPTLSSFENLWNLREKNGMRNFVAFGFKGTYRATQSIKPARKQVIDLSDTELMSLPGFRTASTPVNNVKTETAPSKVKVTKVKKEKIK